MDNENKIHKLDIEISDFLKTSFNNYNKLFGVDKIAKLDSLLNCVENTRYIINKIKKIKDEEIKYYIFNVRPPETLNKTLLTYKALLMYFRNSFIEKKISLNITKYIDKNKINNNNLKKFFPLSDMKIKVYLNNFPHLIGIRKGTFGESSKDVIEHILYEHKLIDDFDNDNATTDIAKLESFSWIISTLYNPSWIINKNGIKAENFQADLVFIKSIYYSKDYKGVRKYNYHIVGLDLKIRDNECFFVIKSQFPIKSKSILEKKFDLKKNSSLLFKGF